MQENVSITCICVIVATRRCLTVILGTDIFQRHLSIINFTPNYPPIRNNLTSASLLSMLIETDYNLKKNHTSFLQVLFKRIPFCLEFYIRLSPGCPFHPVVSKSCNRTKFGRTYRTYRKPFEYRYVIFFISLYVFGQYLCILKNSSSASLRIKVSSSCLIKCRRIVSKSVDELSQKRVAVGHISVYFGMFWCFFVVTINSPRM